MRALDIGLFVFPPLAFWPSQPGRLQKMFSTSQKCGPISRVRVADPPPWGRLLTNHVRQTTSGPLISFQYRRVDLHCRQFGR